MGADCPQPLPCWDEISRRVAGSGLGQEQRCKPRTQGGPSCSLENKSATWPCTDAQGRQHQSLLPARRVRRGAPFTLSSEDLPGELGTALDLIGSNRAQHPGQSSWDLAPHEIREEALAQRQIPGGEHRRVPRVSARTRCSLTSVTQHRGGCIKAHPISQAYMNICTLKSCAFRKG